MFKKPQLPSKHRDGLVLRIGAVIWVFKINIDCVYGFEMQHQNECLWTQLSLPVFPGGGLKKHSGQSGILNSDATQNHLFRKIWYLSAKLISIAGNVYNSFHTFSLFSESCLCQSNKPDKSENLRPIRGELRISRETSFLTGNEIRLHDANSLQNIPGDSFKPRTISWAANKVLGLWYTVSQIPFFGGGVGVRFPPFCYRLRSALAIGTEVCQKPTKNDNLLLCLSEALRLFHFYIEQTLCRVTLALK